MHYDKSMQCICIDKFHQSSEKILIRLKQIECIDFTLNMLSHLRRYLLSSKLNLIWLLLYYYRQRCLSTVLHRCNVFQFNSSQQPVDSLLCHLRLSNTRVIWSSSTYCRIEIIQNTVNPNIFFRWDNDNN